MHLTAVLRAAASDPVARHGRATDEDIVDGMNRMDGMGTL